MLTIAAGILMIIIIVTIHELGHLLAARACGVGVESFSIGFGPGFRIFTAKGIPFYLRFIPLGGYVRIKSHELKDATSEGKNLEDATWREKILIFAAGVAFNLIVAIILRALMFWFAPADTQVQILQLKMSFLQVSDWYLAPFQAIFLTMKNFVVYFIATTFGVGLVVWKTVVGLLLSLWVFCAGTPSAGVSVLGATPFAPILQGGIGGTVGLGTNVHFGFWSFVGLIYLVSLFIAALNAVPLYPFDGGHIAITLTERFLGRNRLSRSLVWIIRRFGVVVLIVLLFNMVASDVFDIHQFIKK